MNAYNRGNQEMSVASDIDGAGDDEEAPKKGSKLPLIIGVVLAIAGGAGAFFATNMGLLPFGPQPEMAKEDEEEEPLLVTEDVAFVLLDPINITLPPGSNRSLLRLTVQLDVAPQNAAAIDAIKPRITDILNSYLRAVQIADLETPSALLRLRTQMLHRVQVVAGPGIVRDLLITEFILN